MLKLTRLTALVLMAGAAAPALAQDSTSANLDGGNGLPGDALDAYAASSQRKSYVATMTPIVTSGGTTFGIVPLIKGTKACSVFFNNLLSAQGISQTILNDVDATGKSYLTWSGPGFGINSAQNSAGASTVFGAEFSKQFAVVFNEGSGGSNCLPTTESQDNAITGIVNFDMAQPSRLHVERIVSAVNKANNTSGTLANAAMGVGAVDAMGNTVFSADNFGTSAANPNRVNGNNYFRVKAQNRSGAVINQISLAGGSNATDFIMSNDPNPHGTPSLIPQDLQGTRSVLLGSNFIKQYVRETGVNTLTSDTSQLGAMADIRGNVSFSKKVLFPGSLGTATMLGKTSSSGQADAIIVWGVNSSGNVTTQRSLVIPNAISDTCDAFTATGWEFDGYHSQTRAQGGSGMSAVGMDQAGRALVAGTMYDNDTWINAFLIGVVGSSSVSVWDNANPYNAITVGRFDPSNPNSAVTWKLAAWVDFDYNSITSTGKPILDETGTPIGRLCSFWDVHQDPNRQFQWGPNFSEPVFDAAGNVWFLSFVELFDRLPGGGSDFDSALIRAVYDPENFCYTLEKVFELGEQITGSDSTVNYQINFLDIVDGDGSTGTGDPSNSSGSIFTNNGLQAAWANVPNGGMPPVYPQHLGGLVLSAKIIYDVDNNGLYQDPTGNVTSSTDEAYNVLLYVGNVKPCPADTNGDGFVDLSDYFQFFNDFDTFQLGADIDGNGEIDLNDFFQFLNSFDGGC